MLKRLGVGVALVALVATGCATQEEEPTGGADRVTIQVDGETDEFVAEFTHFFPHEFTVRQGTTIDFELAAVSGGPHTVTFGKVADDAVAKLKELGPEATLAQQESTPEMLKLVDVFPHQPPTGGPPSPNMSAALPCFLDSGEPPNSKTGGAPACEERERPAFDGAQSFYNSGLLFEEGDSFSMPLADDIEPGAYSFICLIHRGAMTGTVTVVGEGEEAQTAAEIDAAAKMHFEEAVEKLRPAAQQLQEATGEGGEIQAGAGVPGVPQGIVAEFGPDEIEVEAGQKLAFNVFFFHTISASAPEEAVGIFVRDEEGNPAFNPQLGAPSNSPPPPPEVATFPPPDDGKPVTIDAGTWDGEGFLNSGLIGSVPPALATYEVTISEPGTYNFRCLIHPDMKAKVTVT